MQHLEDMANNFRAITEERRWKQEAEKFLGTESFSEEFVIHFHSVWTVSGHHIRSQIGDDILLAKLLWHVLPKYPGPDITLYRGENLERWKAGSIGFCWTPSQEIASMFGRGLNARDTGGMLLSCECKADWIISAPNKHSKYLGEDEYTVDPGQLVGVERLIGYAPID